MRRALYVYVSTVRVWFFVVQSNSMRSMSFCCVFRSFRIISAYDPRLRKPWQMSRACVRIMSNCTTNWNSSKIIKNNPSRNENAWDSFPFASLLLTCWFSFWSAGFVDDLLVAYVSGPAFWRVDLSVLPQLPLWRRCCWLAVCLALTSSWLAVLPLPLIWDRLFCRLASLISILLTARCCLHRFKLLSCAGLLTLLHKGVCYLLVWWRLCSCSLWLCFVVCAIMLSIAPQIYSRLNPGLFWTKRLPDDMIRFTRRI